MIQGRVASYQEYEPLTALEAEGASNEFKSFLLEVRRRNRQVVSSIKDCFSFMRQSETFTCQEHLARVAQLSSVLVVPPEVKFPDVEISLSGVAAPHKILTSATMSVQSYGYFPSFSSGELLTNDCFDDVMVNLPDARSFTGDASFSPWSSLYCVDHRDLYRGLRDRFDAYFFRTGGQLASP